MNVSCGKSFFPSCKELKGSGNLGFFKRRCHFPTVVKSKMGKAATTFSCNTITDLPLSEPPKASFDHYLEDKARVFRAVLPDKKQSQQISEDQWRVYMSKIRLFYLSYQPVIDMRIRCKSGGVGYPPEVPRDARNVVEIDIVKWELQEAGGTTQPFELTICGTGALYPYRSKSKSRLKGFSTTNVSFVLPPLLDWVPEEVLRNALETVLKGLVQNMSYQMNKGLLTDYDDFKREKLPESII